MYRQFLHFKDFFAATKPTILSEGETDNVYLVHALRSLAPKFPDLVAKAADGGLSLRVRLYKYASTRKGAVLGLTSGGTSQVSSFIDRYVSDTEKFTADVCANPLLIVYDNDSGKDKVESTIRALKASIPAAGSFSYFPPNVYFVPVPLNPGKTQTAIEDLFPNSVLDMKVDGKTFNSKNKGRQPNEYGKVVFAHKVVRANADKIDFAGFHPLFSTISKVLSDFQTRKSVITGTVPPKNSTAPPTTK